MPHPKVKLSDDSGNAVGVTSNALDVNIAGGTADIDIGDVSLLLGGTAASTNAGTMDAQTLRVTLATDDTHWGEVGAGSDVDGVAHGQLNYIGIQAANTYGAISGVRSDIQTGNGMLYTIDVDTGNIATSTSTIAGAVDGSEMQVDIVSGTVTANLGTTDNAVLDAMVVDLAAMEALLITIDSDTDAIKTATEKIDNPVKILGTDAYSETNTNGMVAGVVRNDTLASLVNLDNEIADPLILRANLLQTAILFYKELNILIDSKFSMFNPKCRQNDLNDMENMGLYDLRVKRDMPQWLYPNSMKNVLSKFTDSSKL